MKISKRVYKLIAVAAMLLLVLLIGYFTPIKSLLAKSLKTSGAVLTVLMYHEIMDDEVKNTLYSDNEYVVSVSKFREQMHYLKDKGFTSVTSEEIIDYFENGKKLPEKAVYITFDDGYTGNVYYGYDILKEFGFKAVIFNITKNTPNVTDYSDMSKLTHFGKDAMVEFADVFEFASHCHLMHTMVNENQSALQYYTAEEIKADILESHEYPMNAKKVFAYPYGRYNDTAIQALKDAGIKLAITTKNEFVKKTSDPMLLPRFGVYASYDLERFKTLVDY